MANYITDDICEEFVVICEPNEIVQDCLPGGEDLICLYTIELDVPYAIGEGEGEQFNPFDNFITTGFDEEQTFYGDVQFDLSKMIKVDADTGIQQEFWLGEASGGVYNDSLSGKGLLDWINYSTTDNNGAVAQFATGGPDPRSVYLGDLINFDIHGGAGNDFVEGANNADRLFGDSGYDEIYAHGGDDYVEGGTQGDDIYGGLGNDILWGDLATGETVSDGNDFIVGGAGYGIDPETRSALGADDEIVGGGGNDEIYGDEVRGETSLDGNDNLLGGSGDDDIYGRGGNDYILGETGNDYIEAGSGDDCAEGGAGNDEMYMGSGNDKAKGDAGNDYMEMGSGDDVALGGIGDDEMYGDSGNDRLDGEGGNDYVDGGDGNDLVDGGDGDDHVNGGDGDDIVRGGIGSDKLTGGEGCDVFAFCEVDFNCDDIITDFSNDRDPDQIDLTQLTALDSIRVEETGFEDSVRLDLIIAGQTVQTILVESDDGANLQSLFEKDTAFGSDQGSVVKIGAGVMVDLPTTSLMVEDDGMFF